MRRIVKGILIAPLAVIPAILVYNTIEWVLGAYFYRVIDQPTIIEVTLVFSLYAVPTAYIGILAVGLPLYFILKKLDKLNLPYILISAAIAGMLAVIPLGVLFGIKASPVSLMVLGFSALCVAFVAWYIAVREESQ